MNNPVQIDEAPESLYLMLEPQGLVLARPVIVRDTADRRLVVAFTFDGLQDGFTILMDSCGLAAGVYLAEEMEFSEIAGIVTQSECAGVAIDYSPDEPYQVILIVNAKYGEG